MQIRLTVVDPLRPSSAAAPDRAASCDVLITAPAGTALAAVASALASALPGGDPSASGSVVLYAGARRLDPQRCTLGEPPLIDGAVLTLGAPGEPEPHPEADDAPARLHVVAGPDAGGVHLLHGGQIRLGRSADADVALDDPDVSRFHCAVTVAADGRVSVADLGSTNGTTLDGARVGDRPVPFAPGALLRIGESALRLAPGRGGAERVATTPDGEGHVRVAVPADGSVIAGGVIAGAADGGVAAADGGVAAPAHRGVAAGVRAGGAHGLPDSYGLRDPQGLRDTHGPAGTHGPADIHATGTHGMPDEAAPHAYGTAGWGASDAAPGARGHGGAQGPSVPGQGGAPSIESHGAGADPAARRGPSPPTGRTRRTPPTRAGPEPAPRTRTAATAPAGARARRCGVPTSPGRAQARGLAAWARRLTGGRGEQGTAGQPAYDAEPAGETVAAEAPVAAPPVPERWPDPAALLLTALGPGPRLWERGPGHPEALTVRLGTADRVAPGGSAPLPAVPVTAGLREAGALGLAGPRERLSGLARAVLAQLAALHSPDVLEIVLISADRSRSVEERTAEWSWLGWLPHLRPGHGQDCRLLLAHDREQASARVRELVRRLEDHLADARSGRLRPAPPVGTEAGGSAGATGSTGAVPAGHPATGAPASAATPDRTPSAPDGSPAPSRGSHGSSQPAAHGAPPGGPDGVDPAAGPPGVSGTAHPTTPTQATGAFGVPGSPDPAAGAPVPASEAPGSWAPAPGTSGGRAPAHDAPGTPAPAAGPPVTRRVPPDRSAHPHTPPDRPAPPGTPPDRPAPPCRARESPGSRVAPPRRRPASLPRPSRPARRPPPRRPPPPRPRSRRPPRTACPPPTACRRARACPPDRPAPPGGRPGRGPTGRPRSRPASPAVHGGRRGRRSRRRRRPRSGGTAHGGGTPGRHPRGVPRRDGGGLPRLPGDGDVRSGLLGVAGVPAVRCRGPAQRRRGHGPAAAPRRPCPASGTGTDAALPGPVGHGTLGTVDAVSLAWAERFARALAPLRPEGTPGTRHPRVSAPLPRPPGSSTNWAWPGPPRRP